MSGCTHNVQGKSEIVWTQGETGTNALLLTTTPTTCFKGETFAEKPRLKQRLIVSLLTKQIHPSIYEEKHI